MTKAFISYHHENDQWYKGRLSYLANARMAFEDCSVELGEIDDSLSTKTIRQKIRDEYLRDTQVTILLCGTETKYRKHVDWELKSSMINTIRNKRSGILVIYLPNGSGGCIHAGLGLPVEKEFVYPDIREWRSITSKAEYQSMYPALPERIIDNMINPNVRLSVVPWRRIENNPDALRFLVDATARVAASNEYDCSLPMRMRNG